MNISEEQTSHNESFIISTDDNDLLYRKNNTITILQHPKNQHLYFSSVVIHNIKDLLSNQLEEDGERNLYDGESVETEDNCSSHR